MIKPFGAWSSPISSNSLVEKTLRLGQIQLESNRIFWTEGRPEENGRTALMTCEADGVPRELYPSTFNSRTRVHEYGGKPFFVKGDTIFAVSDNDQQIYALDREAESPAKLTQADKCRFADMTLSPDGKSLVAVCEDHSDLDRVENYLVTISLQGENEMVKLSSGHDFYSNPEISPDGQQICFLTWDYPNMPWDGTELWLGDLNEDGRVDNMRMIAGGRAISIFQPQWGPEGELFYISDESGWWNLYRYKGGMAQCVLDIQAEFGLPQWLFGMSTYAVLPAGKVAATYRDQAGSHLILIGSEAAAEEIRTGYTEITQLRGDATQLAFIGGRPDGPSELVVWNLDTAEKSILRQSSQVNLDAAYISLPQSICFESQPGELAYAWFYPPKNPEFEGPAGERPPLIVLSHGGPTANSSATLSMAKQYWTSRGFAVVDVNYSGSTGYGRAYRDRLKGNWGIRDVDDCANAALHLVEQDLVDPDRLIIKGGSAGGYTTLASLAFQTVFKAGASYYGVADLELLVKDTHKFESRYLDQLIGRYPEDRETYIQRSPIHSTDTLNCPVIFLQGMDDPVVPPNQAEMMLAALKAKNIPVAYVSFEGESHGFRQASTIIRATESELYFYGRIFGFEPADLLEPVEIFNL